MKKFITFPLFLFFIFLFPSMSFALDESKSGIILGEIEVNISVDEPVEVGRNVLLSGKDSQILSRTHASFVWQVDGQAYHGKEVVVSFDTPGQHKVILTITQDGRSARSEKIVYVYDRVLTLLVDDSLEEEKRKGIQMMAAEEGVFIHLISSKLSDSEFFAGAEFKEQLKNSEEFLSKSYAIAFFTRGLVGLNALRQFYKENPTDFHSMDIVVFTEENLNITTKLASGVYRTIEPNQIIVTRQEALNLLFSTTSIKSFLSSLTNRVIAFEEIDSARSEFKIWNFLSVFVDYILGGGVPTETLYLILAIPLIALIVAFLRMMIGVETFGVYLPTIFALSFMVLGIKVGLILLIIILLTGSFARFLLKKVRILYVPKVAIIVSFTALSILLVLGFAAYFNKTEIVTLTIFPMLVMSTLAEKFMSAQSDRGLQSAFLATLETVFAALVAAFIATRSQISTFILSYPEVVFLFILLIYLIGRWTGLRLMEVIRFRAIIKQMEE